MPAPSMRAMAADIGLANRRGLPNEEEKANEDCGRSPAR